MKYRVAVRRSSFTSFISCIKEWRTATGSDLRDSKDICAALWEGQVLDVELDPYTADRLSVVCFDFEEDTGHSTGITFGNVRRNVFVFIENDGKKINAIKKLRIAVNYGLKESKDILDEMWSTNKPIQLKHVSEKEVFGLRSSGFIVNGWKNDSFQGQEDLFEI